MNLIRIILVDLACLIPRLTRMVGLIVELVNST